MDQSELDQKYFIDNYVYNCAFCRRRNVQYFVSGRFSFDWSNNKNCNGYLVKCSSCKKESMHLTFEFISTEFVNHEVSRFKDIKNTDLDDLFFYSVPTSFFILDNRIPRVLRELFSEAEGCLKSNFLTGASACIRKIIYELGVLENAKGENYDERIKSLKDKTNIDSIYFDTLLTIQQVTSSKVHEQSLDGWEGKHIRIMLSTISEILKELYVIPKVREENRKKVLDLKKKLTNDKDDSKTAN